MAYLGDFLGHLLSEITMARVQADLEAVRVAELYAGHPLLKTLPVPHFRLPTLTLDVPVAVKSIDEVQPGASPRGGVALPRLRERFKQVLDAHLESADVSLSPAERTRLDEALDEAVPGKISYVSTSVLHLADEMVWTTMSELRQTRRIKSTADSARLEKLANDLKADTRAEFLSLREAPPRLSVLATSAELKEAGPSHVLVNLHLSVSEEALEWSIVESQGKSNARLVPE
jgi:hypothetical protein